MALGGRANSEFEPRVRRERAGEFSRRVNRHSDSPNRCCQSEGSGNVRWTHFLETQKFNSIFPQKVADGDARISCSIGIGGSVLYVDAEEQEKHTVERTK